MKKNAGNAKQQAIAVKFEKQFSVFEKTFAKHLAEVSKATEKLSALVAKESKADAKLVKVMSAGGVKVKLATRVK